MSAAPSSLVMLGSCPRVRAPWLDAYALTRTPLCPAPVCIPCSANFLASVMKHANQEQNAALNATDPDEAFADKMVANLTEAMIDMFAGFTAAFVALSVDCDMNSLISVDELANLFAQDSGGDMCIAQMLNDAFSGFGGIFAEGEQQSSEAAAETVLFA